MSEFSIACETSDDGQHHVVSLSGELDFASVPAVRAFLLRLNGDVEVNCTALDFVDSAGLGRSLALVDLGHAGILAHGTGRRQRVRYPAGVTSRHLRRPKADVTCRFSLSSQ